MQHKKEALDIEKKNVTITNSQVKKEILLLGYLQKNGAKSRVEMAQKLKITKASITAITNDMLGAGILLEKGSRAHDEELRTRGRRKILLDINENFKLVFGVTIDKDYLFVGLTNLKGQPLDKRKSSIKDKAYREVLEQIVELITIIMRNNCITNDNVLALGLCISNESGGIIEGAKLSDKMTRLKKDLGHALPMKIATCSLISGAITAQRLFGDEKSSNVLMLRCNYVEDTFFAESAVLTLGKSYLGHTGSAGGFNALLKRQPTDTLPNQRIAEAVISCNIVLDTEKIFCFGKYFEEELNLLAIAEIILAKGYKKLVLQGAFISDETLYLAASAVAIDCYFYVNQ